MVNNYNLIILIVYMISTIIGMSLQNLLVNDISELKWISRYNLDNLFLVLITIFYNNIILILGLISLLISGINNNKILLMHWLLIIINTVIICNSVNNNIINIILVIICIDIISVINIIFIQRGEGIWYYFLYQSFMTIIIWWFFILDFNSYINLIYYYKLGSGIGGYYIPSLYSSVINSNINLMIYVGTTNIILMYNPVFLFNLYKSSNNDLLYILLLSNFLFMLLILFLWIYNGYIFINIWLYAISFSTIILANIYYIFPTIDYIYYNLYYYIYYFTITSIIIWFIFLLSLHFINNVNSNINNNSIYISIYNYIIIGLGLCLCKLISLFSYIYHNYLVLILSYFLSYYNNLVSNSNRGVNGMLIGLSPLSYLDFAINGNKSIYNNVGQPAFGLYLIIVVCYNNNYYKL